jgi:hypothetical protein
MATPSRSEVDLTARVAEIVADIRAKAGSALTYVLHSRILVTCPRAASSHRTWPARLPAAGS